MDHRPTRLLTAAILSSLALAAAAPAESPSPAAAKQAPAAEVQKALTLMNEEKYGEAIDALDSALASLHELVDFQVRNLLLAAGDVPGFGMYTRRPSNVFGSGEQIFIYMEPLGFDTRPAGDKVQYGFRMNLYIKNPAGEVLMGKEGFLDHDFETARRVRELFVQANVSLTGAPAGEYVIALDVEDKVGGKSRRIEVPIRIQ